MKFYIGNYSDIGISRENNEDSVFSAVIPVNAGKLCIGMVCDGIGGMKHGEFASYTITEKIGEWFMNVDPALAFDDISRQFLDKIYKLNVYICEQSKLLDVETGSTLTAFIALGERYMIANVGDSRTYRLDSVIECVTQDDVNVLSTGKSVLSQCVGYSDKLYINTYYGNAEHGGCFLMCSDGFYKKMNEGRLLRKCRSINRFTDITRILEKETDSIKKMGERDNISAVLIKCIKGE